MGKTLKGPNPQQLRKTAEEKLARKTIELTAPRTSEILADDLLHELKVHQIELEMQNDTLRQAQAVIEESRDRYMDLYDFAPVGYLTLTREGMISAANLTGATLLGVERSRLKQRRFAPLVATEDRDRWDGFFVGMFHSEVRQHCELSLKRSDKTAFHAQLDCLPIKTDGLSTVRIALTDISERKLKDEELREKEQFFRMIAENTTDFIAVLNLKGRRIYLNSSYNRLFGDFESKNGSDSFAEIHPDDRKYVKQVFDETVNTGIGMQMDFRFVLADGSICYMESRGGAVKNSQGRVSHIIVVSRDVTARRLTEDRIHNLAFHDHLTKLPNRRLLNDRLLQSIAASKRSVRFVAMMFIDLDNFKPLNDQHGHATGDQLLVEAARRICKCVRETDTVSRIGGDEFVVLLSELNIDGTKSKKKAGIVAEKIRVALAKPYSLTLHMNGKAGTLVTHRCTSSIGVVLFVNQDISTDEIMKRADWAMYQAKKSGRNAIRFFDPDSRVADG